MKPRWFFSMIVLFVFFSWLPQGRVWSVVTLKYFDVQWDESTQQVILRWETASELDNLGFQVERKVTGSAEDFTLVRLCNKSSGCTDSEKTDFASASGDTIGKLYGDYFDNEVQRGISYTYQLIAIDTSQREEVAETKTIVISGQPIPTNASTSPAVVLSPTLTNTPRQNNPNPRRTPTPIPPTATLRIVQSTATPLPATMLQEPTDTPEPSPTETPTELLIPTLPLPSITLIFPDTPTPQIELPTETPAAGTIPQNATWFTPSRLLVIGLIVMVWVILGGWFIFALRKIQ